MKKIKSEKKKNPYTKNIRVQARLDNAEMQIVLEKTLLYTAENNVSDWVREAILNYKPIAKKAAK